MQGIVTIHEIFLEVFLLLPVAPDRVLTFGKRNTA